MRRAVRCNRPWIACALFWIGVAIAAWTFSSGFDAQERKQQGIDQRFWATHSLQGEAGR